MTPSHYTLAEFFLNQKFEKRLEEARKLGIRVITWTASPEEWAQLHRFFQEPKWPDAHRLPWSHPIPILPPKGQTALRF